jgi:hypothetical protein
MDIKVDAKNGERICLKPGNEEIGVYTGSDNYCRVWVDKPEQPLRIFITPPYNEETVLRIFQMVEYIEKAHHWRDCDVCRQGKYNRKPGVILKQKNVPRQSKTEQDIRSSSLPIDYAGRPLSDYIGLEVNPGPEDMVTSVKVRRGADENPYFLPIWDKPKSDNNVNYGGIASADSDVVISEGASLGVTLGVSDSASASTYSDLAASLDRLPDDGVKDARRAAIDKQAETIRAKIGIIEKRDSKPKAVPVKVRRVPRVRRIDLSI